MQDTQETNRTEAPMPEHKTEDRTTDQVPEQKAESRTADQAPDQETENRTADQAPEQKAESRTADQAPDQEMESRTADQTPEQETEGRTADPLPAEQITVRMTAEFLYDFTLYHTFSKFSGFLVNILGIAIAFMGLLMRFTGRATPGQMVFYFVASVGFLAYTPLLLHHRAKSQVKNIDIYREPNVYTFDEEGVHVACMEKVTDYAWDRFERVIATPKTIGFYYGANDALIIPKEQFGDRFVPILKMAATYCKPFTVRIG